jgi:2-hydroxymuconate-semialdehyde hydrolase
MKNRTLGIVEFNHLRIAFERSGQGKPIVFMHNGGADRTVWIHQLEHFSKSYEVWAFDFIGYGESDKPDRPFTLDDQLAQLETFLEANGIEKPILVGNCVGASTAIEFARKHPDKVEKLVLANVCGGPSFHSVSDKVSNHKRLMRFLTWVYARLLYSPKILWGKPPRNDDPLYLHFKNEIVPDPGFYRSRKNMTLGSVTFSKFARPLTMPSGFPQNILFWGAMNKIMQPQNAETCLRYLKSESFYSVPDSGHFCMYEKPGFVNAIVDKFLAGHL